MKSITLLFKVFLAVVICIAIVQISAVYLLRFMQPDLAPADLIVILSGSKERITYGCMVAAEQKTGNLMLINNSSEVLGKYAKRFDVPDSVAILDGAESRSSFEDIFHTVQTLKDGNFDSVILVSSDYHLPRTLFLLYAFNRAVGNELSIQYLATKKKADLVTRLQLLYNETVKLWGSTIEMGGCLITRQLPLDKDKLLQTRNWLKDILLFQV